MTEPTTLLESKLKAYMNINACFLNDLAGWAKTCSNSHKDAEVRQFKAELRAALEHPGTITPKLYEQLTYGDMDNQAEVQQQLQEIWDACFG